MSDVKALVAEAREFADRNNGMNWQGVVLRLADALEVSVQDAWEVEARGLEKAAGIVDAVVLVNGGANKDKNEAAVIAADDIRARAQQVRKGN